MSAIHGLTGFLDAADVEAFHASLELQVASPSKAALAAIVGRMLQRVPFQNICMLARPRRAPTLAEIRDDMLSCRGGPCGHQNPFLAALLHELGYDVDLVSGAMQAPDCHIALIVNLAGEKLWVDVGNGFPYFEPIALDDARPHRHPMLEYRLVSREGGRYQVEHRPRGHEAWVRNYDFDTTPRSFDFFEDMIDSHYSRPGYGPFLLGLRVNRHLPDRSIVLRNRVMRLLDSEKDESFVLDDSQLSTALSEHFPKANLPLREALEKLSMQTSFSEPRCESETCSFSSLDLAALEFLREHGYVVLAPQFDAEQLSEPRNAWRVLRQRWATQMGLALEHYDAQVSQWRDMWRHDPTFARLLSDARIWQTAATGLGSAGARLLHDHIIAKPSGGLNGTIPWHQDATYWPVDRSGLSCWLPFDDVGPNGGCLEVVDGSHHWGAGAPADFIAGPRTAFPVDARFVRLPAKAGSIVVLDGLTWHRSSPNLDGGERLVYISLWLPPNTRYVPVHAAWHPVNEHIEVEAGEVIEGEWFPCFGNVACGAGDDYITRLDHSGPALDVPLTMFEASRMIAGQISWLLGQPGTPLALALAGSQSRADVVASALAKGLLAPDHAGRLSEILEQLWVSAEAYRLHRARNVYNAAYVAWWELLGRKCWEAGQRDQG